MSVKRVNKEPKEKRKDYVITKEDITDLAKEQEGNKILEALGGLAIALRDKDNVQER